MKAYAKIRNLTVKRGFPFFFYGEITRVRRFFISRELLGNLQKEIVNKRIFTFIHEKYVCKGRKEEMSNLIESVKLINLNNIFFKNEIKYNHAKFKS